MGTLPRACPGVRCPQFFVALAALILFVPLCCSFTQFGSEEDDALYRMCHNAIDTRDPVCLHGGHLYAKNRSHPDNCASCICPEGWAGVDCSLCTSKSVCPPRLLEDGSQQDATQCTKDSILPIDEEMQEGKMLSCECGGLPGDVTTEWVCQQQPGTNWAIHLLSNSTAPWYSEKGAVLSVYERAGIPSQDLFPERTCTKKGCISNAHYKYAYPAVWKGNLTGCSWGMGPCVPPLTGSSCFIYTCHDARIKCPPDDIPKCPGWTNTSCAKPPGEYQPYWTHHCLPMALPWPGKTSTVACNSTAAADGSFQCYLKQEDSVFAAAIGMRCRTGSCMYAHPSPGPPPTPPPAPPHHGGKWPGVGHREMLAILSTATLLVGMAGAAAMLIRRDLQSTKAEFSTPSLRQPLIQDEEEGGGYDSGAPDVSLLTPEQLPEGLMLSWEGIQYDLPLLTSGARRRILQGVSGITMRSTADQSASCVFALLGPSGAGKTTLLDILAGRKSGEGVHGRIRMGGVPVSADRMRHISGYVLQDDVLPGTSTVWEYLSFHAELRLPAAERQGSLQDRRVWNIIRLLGLTKIANSFIGDKYTRGLSSGEKRRVSIATELLTRPGLLFLDEPTTGLDSTNACKVVDILSSLSVRGVNVVLSIHQPRPDILRLLDRVLLLSGTGQQVYSGPVAAAAAHFESMGFSRPHASINIADFMLDTIIRSAPEAVDGMVQAFASSAVLQEDHNVLAQAVAARVDAASRKQLQGKLRDNYVVRVLSVRLLRKAYRHPFLIMLNYVATAVMAVVVGLIFWHAGLDTAGMQNRFGVLFFILLYLSLMSLSSLPIWRDDHLLFARERDAGAYGSSAYYLAMVAFEFLPMRVLPPSFFVLFTYWMVGLHPKCGSCVLWFLAVLVLANMAGAAMSMLIGAASPNNAVANMMCSIAILSCFLFSGFMLNKDAMHHAAGASLETTPLADAAVHNTTHSVPAVFEWLGRLSFANHAYEALVVNEYHHSPLGFTFDVPGTNGSQWHIPAVSGDTVLRAFGFRPDNFYVDLLAVLLLGAAFSAGTYLLLLQSGASQPSVASTARLLLSWLPLPPSAAAAATESGTDSPIRLGNCEEAPAEVADGLPLLQDKHCEAQEQPQNAAAASAAPAAAPPADGVRVSNGVSWPAAHGGGKPAAQALVLSWEGVEFRVAASRDGQRQQVLAGVCGIAGRRGGGIRSSVLAILGPSGAGKTTLLDILAGRLTAGASGSIRLNGHRVRPAAVRQLCGYVPDDDVFPGTSTVLEYLSFHARLRLPRSVSAAARLARVQQLLQELGLAKVTLSTIGDNWSRGLSGGEKRRLTIAAELLTQPGLLFLDEPTTGLDSTNALNVVDIMARLAARGVTMVMSIHQPRPDIFRLLDQMLLLSGDGRPAFSGTTEAAPAFFAQLGCSPLPHVHIADHVLDLVIRSPPAQAHALVDAFAASAPRADLAQQILHLTAEAAQPGAAAAWRLERRARRKYTAPTWVQLRALSARMLRNTWRHRMMVAINFVSTALVAGGLGLIYRDIGRDTAGIQDRFGALFFMIMYLSLMSLSSLPIWREDRLLFMRERDGGVYSTGAYFWSVVMFDLLPMRVLPPLFFGALSYWMIGLRGPGLGHVAVFLLVLVQTNVLAASMSMAIGAASPSNSVANMIGGLAVLLSLLFAGYLLSREKMRPGIRWLSWLCHTRYAFEALLINEFRDNSGFRLTPYSPAGPGTSPVPGLDVDGNTILHMFGFSRHAFAADLAAMLAFTAGYLLLTFLLLRRRRR